MQVAAAHQAGGRVAERDALLIMMAYRHGLPASELTGLRWDLIDLKAGALLVVRRKNGSPSTHPLRGPELRALRPWKRQLDEMAPYVFTSLRGGPPTIRTIHFVVAAAGKAAGIKFPFTPHAPACRLLSGERRPGHTGNSALPGAQEYSAHRALHGAIATEVQGFLEGLNMSSISHDSGLAGIQIVNMNFD